MDTEYPWWFDLDLSEIDEWNCTLGGTTWLASGTIEQRSMTDDGDVQSVMDVVSGHLESITLPCVRAVPIYDAFGKEN